MAAPVQWWSGHDGEISVDGVGLAYADVNLIGGLRLTLDGLRPVPIDSYTDGVSATFTSVVRHLQDELRDGPDPHVALTRHRALTPRGAAETLTIDSRLTTPLTTDLKLEVITTATPIDKLKQGRSTSAPAELDNGVARWGTGGVPASLTASNATLSASDNGTLDIEQTLYIPPLGQAALAIAVDLTAASDATPTIATIAAPLQVRSHNPGSSQAAEILVTVPWNVPPENADQDHPVSVYYAALTLDPSKTVRFVTLPANPNLHVFALAIGGS